MTDPVAPLIESKLSDSIYEIILNRPDKLNALTDAMYGELIEQFNRAASDTSIKVVLLRSSSKHFCAGNDLADFLQTEFNLDSNVVQFLITLASFNKPVIAAVSGAAVGIGTTMLLHCDLVLAAQSAKFSLPFIKLGLTPEGGSSRLLARRCGELKANDWLYTGRNVLADEALSSGLVNQVCLDEEASWKEAFSLASSLSQNPLAVLVETKAVLKGGRMQETIELIKAEAEVFARRLGSEEAKAAFNRFLGR